MEDFQTLSLFCPACHAYLGPSMACCHAASCASQRPPAHRLPAPGAACWKQFLPGPSVGRPQILDGQLVAVWGQSHADTRPNPGGGLAWLDPASGQICHEYRTALPPSGEFVQVAGKIILGLKASGNFGNGAVVAVNTATYQPDWGPIPLPGAFSGALVVNAGQALLACGDGQIHRFNLQNGSQDTPIRFLPSDRILAGPKGLLATRHGLFLADPGSRGQIIKILPPHNQTLAELRDHILWLSLLDPQRLLAGTDSGRLVCIEISSGTSLDWLNCKGALLAAPLIHEGVLYVGANDHLLRAVDLASRQERWRFEAEGSLQSTPLIQGQWLFAADSHGVCYCLEAKTGQEVWRYPLEPVRAGEKRPSLRAAPAWDQNRLFWGASDGQVLALPWHLGQFDKVVNRVAPAQQGEYWAAQADYDPDPVKQKEERRNAAAAWEKAGRSDKAAAMWEANREQRLAALAYRMAAQGVSLTNPDLASRWLVKAYGLWQDLYWKGSAEAEDHRAMIQDDLNSLPLVRIPQLCARDLNHPVFIERAKGWFSFEIRNVGKVAAHQVQIRLSGGLDHDLFFSCADTPAIPEFILPGQELSFRFEIIPTRTGTLTVGFIYQDYMRQYPLFNTTLKVQLEVKPSTVIQVVDVNQLNVLDADNVVIYVESIGMLKTSGKNNEVNSAEIGAVIRREGTPAAKLVCPHCHFEILPETSFCINCGKNLK